MKHVYNVSGKLNVTPIGDIPSHTGIFSIGNNPVSRWSHLGHTYHPYFFVASVPGPFFLSWTAVIKNVCFEMTFQIILL